MSLDGTYSSPMASLVLTDSSQLTSDSQHLGEFSSDILWFSLVIELDTISSLPASTCSWEFVAVTAASHLRKNYPSSPEQNSNRKLPILGSLAQHKTGALANYVTEADN
uniref:(California timema) hypothetical protein n=1 Tax=Timema californicum TaxID=61474 RepID=A0A7R9JJC7_TIMCA|nr:unnamed protein product [Timema californicum]